MHPFTQILTSSLQLHPQRLIDPQTLPDAQIQHDFLTTTRDGISPDISVQPLDGATLATSRVTKPTEDLTCLTSAELECDSRLRLEASNSTTELQHGLDVVHGVALEDHILEPGVRGFDLAVHVGELEADDGMVDELLAEGAALVGVLHGLFVADAGEAETLDDDADTLVAG